MMLISTAFFVQLQTDTKKQDKKEEEPKIPVEPDKLDPVEYGPKVSFQSLSSGTVTSIPQENAKATYGLYDQNGIFGTPDQRIGEINEENLGKVTFQGEQCILVKTEGRIIIPMDEYIESYRSMSTTQEQQEILNQIPNEISYYIYSDYYLKPNDYTPVYMDYKIDFTEAFEILKEISISYGNASQEQLEFDEVIIGYIIDWNREESKADMRLYIDGFSFMNMDSNFTVEFSEEYWNMCPELDELYVGFEKIVNFTMNLKMNDFSYSYNEYEEYETEEVTVSSSNSQSQQIEEYEYSDSQSDIYEDESEDYISSIENTMKFNVIDQEDLYLDCGNFTDCYVIEIEQNQINSYDYSYESSSTSSTKIWINKNGVMPKAEYTLLGNSGMSGSSSQKLLIILEEYTK